MPVVPQQILSIVKEEVERDCAKVISVEGIAKRNNISKKDLQIQFKHCFGVSITNHHKKHKLSHLKNLIIADGENFRKLSYTFAVEVGYSNDSSLQSFVKSMTGRSFSEYYNIVKSRY